MIPDETWMYTHTQKSSGKSIFPTALAIALLKRMQPLHLSP